MKQVLFFTTLAEDLRSYRCIARAKNLGIFIAFYTLVIMVFRGLLANIVEPKALYISFKSFYASASASACS